MISSCSDSRFVNSSSVNSWTFTLTGRMSRLWDGDTMDAGAGNDMRSKQISNDTCKISDNSTETNM